MSKRKRVTKQATTPDYTQCDWCHATDKQVGEYPTTPVKSWLDSGSFVVDNKRRLCADCATFTQDNRERWAEVRRAPVEVLSLTAAEIVRATFSQRAIREDFKFKANEPEQLVLVVPRVRRSGHWSDTADAGYRYIDDGERTVQVPFSLAETEDGRFKQHLAEWTRAWRGVALVAKASGVLRPAERAKRVSA